MQREACDFLDPGIPDASFDGTIVFFLIIPVQIGNKLPKPQDIMSSEDSWKVLAEDAHALLYGRDATLDEHILYLQEEIFELVTKLSMQFSIPSVRNSCRLIGQVLTSVLARRIKDGHAEPLALHAAFLMILLDIRVNDLAPEIYIEGFSLLLKTACPEGIAPVIWETKTLSLVPLKWLNLSTFDTLNSVFGVLTNPHFCLFYARQCFRDLQSDKSEHQAGFISNYRIASENTDQTTLLKLLEEESFTMRPPLSSFALFVLRDMRSMHLILVEKVMKSTVLDQDLLSAFCGFICHRKHHKLPFTENMELMAEELVLQWIRIEGVQLDLYTKITESFDERGFWQRLWVKRGDHLHDMGSNSADRAKLFLLFGTREKDRWSENQEKDVFELLLSNEKYKECLNHWAAKQPLAEIADIKPLWFLLQGKEDEIAMELEPWSVPWARLLLRSLESNYTTMVSAIKKCVLQRDVIAETKDGESSSEEDFVQSRAHKRTLANKDDLSPRKCKNKPK